MQKLIFFTILSLLTTAANAFNGVDTVPDQRAAQYAQRITGVNLRMSDVKTLNRSSEELLLSDLFSKDGFFLYRLPTFISRLSNEESDPFQEPDDFQLSLMAAIRDDIDIRRLFTESYQLMSDAEQLIPSTLTTFLESNDLRLISRMTEIDFTEDFSELSQGEVSQGAYVDGIFSTSGSGRRFLSGGTNRRTIRAVYDIFLCAPIESWQNASLDHFYIGKDVTRHPGDSTATFETKCAACHAPMDAQRGAFAYYDFDGGLEATTKSDSVVQKYLQNADVYPEGVFETTDDSWENPLVTTADRLRFGWRTPTSGTGVTSFAQMVVNSEAFQKCMTRKLLKSFCDLTDKEIPAILNTTEFKRLANQFRANDYKMKTHIKNIVKSDLCLKR